MKPTYDFGDAPASYGISDHKIVNDLFLGLTTDGDTGNWGNGIDNNGNASDDDTLGDPAGGIDDEDGAPNLVALIDTSTTFSVDVYASNNTTATANLIAWIDFNNNGIFEASEAASATIPTASNNTVVTLNWTGISGLVPGTVYLRLRLSTDATMTTLTPTGSAINGEVEDYPLSIIGFPLPSITKLVQTLGSNFSTPGAVMEYTISISNLGTGTVDANTISISDPFPAQLSLIIDYDGAGPINGPIAFTDVVTSGLTYIYPADIVFKDALNNTITPTAGGNGSDPLVRKIIINPKGILAGKVGATIPTMQMKFKMIIK